MQSKSEPTSLAPKYLSDLFVRLSGAGPSRGKPCWGGGGGGLWTTNLPDSKNLPEIL